VVYTALAASSAIMLWNLNRNGRRAEVERRDRLREIDEALAASGPPAQYPWERQA